MIDVVSCSLFVVVSFRWCVLCVVALWLLSFGVVLIVCWLLLCDVRCCCVLFGARCGVSLFVGSCWLAICSLFVVVNLL